MPTMTASTIPFTPEATILPSTFSAVEEGEGNDDEARERRELELDQGHEELHRQNEEGDEHQEPGHHEHGDLDEIREEARKSHHLARRVEQRLTGVEADLGEMAGLQEGR